MFEYQYSQTEAGTERQLRCKLTDAKTELPQGEESLRLVEFLKQKHFTDETIAKLALELAATDKDLGLPFAAEVMLLLEQRFDSEPKRVEVMRILGYSSEDIIGWHFSVDGYAADATARERLQTLVRETA